MTDKAIRKTDIGTPFVRNLRFPIERSPSASQKRSVPDQLQAAQYKSDTTALAKLRVQIAATRE